MPFSFNVIQFYLLSVYIDDSLEFGLYFQNLGSIHIWYVRTERGRGLDFGGFSYVRYVQQGRGGWKYGFFCSHTNWMNLYVKILDKWSTTISLMKVLAIDNTVWTNAEVFFENSWFLVCYFFRLWNSMMITRRCCPLHHLSHLHCLLIWPSSRLFQHLPKVTQNQKTTFLVNLLSDKGVPLCLETVATNHRTYLWTVWLRAKHYNTIIALFWGSLGNTLWPFSISRLKCIYIYIHIA